MRKALHSKTELEAAWAHFQDVEQRGSKEAEGGDWGPFVERWGNLFTEDVTYVDHTFGVMHGRDEVKAWGGIDENRTLRHPDDIRHRLGRLRL